MDIGTTLEIVQMNSMIGELTDSVLRLQKQVDEQAILQLAMIAVLKDKISDFGPALQKAKAAVESSVRDDNEKNLDYLRERFGKRVR